ncbi:diacylglycerol kinase theta isoform X1 [Episyrphus balteatus]|uniref:diacylglycerol kinase theta isoform X1 n=1 Tax=Episyrphus balteatus TaxID=286459 RepID=UPI0024852CB7|nr:diacylglycerol kinase theta isoform X1 [Episyrphus balteatus]
MADGGHSFGKKTFHKPTYCHHCSDLLWGLIGQGYICEVCNFIIHERCVTSVVTPCSGIAPCIIKNPVAHCWSEPTHHKRKFCTVCRKRLDETPAVHCLVCEYFAHIECQDFAVPDCTENATYVPGKELLNVKHQHHWREGNLPPTSKCAYCKKTCWSSECLTGYRCEWCGMTTHGGCRMYLSTECNFGILQPIYLPPHSVSIPRTEVPIEAIIGVQVKSKNTLVRDYSCPELRTIGLCEATTDSDLSIRQELQRNRKRPKTNNSNFHLLLHSSDAKKKSSANNKKSRHKKSTNNDNAADPSLSSGTSRSYTNIFRKINVITNPKSWQKLNRNSNTTEDDIDDIDEEYHNGNATATAIAAVASGSADELDPVFNESFYETSDTGGDLTADDIDSSTNLVSSNISYNSSNASIDNRNSNDNNWHDARSVKLHDSGVVGNYLSTTNSSGRQGGTTTSSYSPNSSESSSVGRSKSFQEPGHTKVPASKRYARFFTKRKTSSNNGSNNNSKSEFNLDTVSQNIEITIQDEDGNYQPYDDNFYAISDNHRLQNGCHDGKIDNEHLFSRLMKRMRRISFGLRKPRHRERRARSISEEFSSGDAPKSKEDEAFSKTDPAASGSGSTGGGSGVGPTHYRADSQTHKSDKDKEKKEKEREERDQEMIKVFDGNSSLRRQLYRVITIARTCTLQHLLTTSLRAFHITRDPSAFYLTDLYAAAGNEDTPLADPSPVLNLIHLEGKRPAIYLRFHDKDNGFVRVYPGKLQSSLEDPYVSVPVDNSTTIKDLIRDALDKFGLQDNQIQDYRCSEVLLDRGVSERILSWNERPWDIMKQLGNDSIRQMELMRFYMQHKQDPHGPNIALFVGNLPPGLSQRNYEQILGRYLTEENKFMTIGPIYYEYGSVVLTFEDSQKAVRAFYNLRETVIEDKKLLVLLLPNIEPSMVPSDVRPLLVFVNVKSGGCQGLELISSFRKLLNPYQVFDLDNGGPLPGLYVFRQIKHYKILVCGGDGTIGWVLQCLDNVGQDSECSSPPCAIVPLGTGNDLARVLCWGSGYTGGEDPLNLLRDVIEAEEIRLDRWTVVFHSDDKPDETALKAPSNSTGKKKKAHQAHLSQQHHLLLASDISGGGAQSEDNSQIYVMNNYFGIGLDADLCLDFHNAREENPNKFNSRLHNKGYYVKMGLRKIVGRKTVKELHKELRLEVDGKVVELPPVEGIIILNILSWGSGANPWGPDKDDQFTTPNHYDGCLEIVGVTGVVHLGQIQSGIRTAMRIAQGGHIKIHIHSDMPVQVDGEPWIQQPGEVVVLKSALKATMLKKSKSKRRLTEPHISPAILAVASSSAHPSTSQQQPPENGDRDKEPYNT